ncbi:MAG TPA: anti-sigma factor [Actinomycetota bacterium]|nr:anti-sigma factor [Actinomycetota bacterium]
MTDDHERNLELLAGYALIALEGSDAEDADRILSDHVPWCITCRAALADFQDLIGDLGLAATPTDPPDLVLARIRRGIEDVPVRRRRGVGMVALVASVAALLGMAGFSLSLGGRATRAEAERGTALEVLNAMRQPGADQVALEASSEGTVGQLVEISGPGLEHMYLYGDEVPNPSEGNAFQLWLGSGDVFVAIGDPFVPQAGVVLLRLTVDPSRYDEILITEEPLGVEPEEPTVEDGHSWRASI